VVNLAGASIGAGRWRAARRRLLTESRVATTERLARALREMPRPPRVLVSASAVGYYGDRGDEALTESSAAGGGFLATLVAAWEAAALAAVQRAAPRANGSAMRVVLPRFGVVLSAQGGALARLLPLFRLGLGGRLGTGRQWMPWIALDDAVGVIRAALPDQPDAERYRGPINVVAPQTVTNAEFTRALAAVLRRPAVLPAPAPLLRLALGRLGDELLLASQCVVPARLLALGFPYRHRQLTEALKYAIHDEADATIA
ncbi:MAG: TIGR01777 family oxidoreductase, partial [Terriglobales bacterium]